jgi:hypothetical protein
MTDNTQDELSKEKGQKIFHKKLHRKLKIDLYKGIKYCLVWGLGFFRENILALILAATHIIHL